MKILKKIGVVIAALIVIVCVVSLFFPTAVTVERSIMVEAPVSTVFANVNQMENWGKWLGVRRTLVVIERSFVVCFFVRALDWIQLLAILSFGNDVSCDVIPAQTCIWGSDDVIS